MIKLLNRERGFAIVEAILAQGILIIGAVSIWSVILTASRLNAESEDRTIATNTAQLKMEQIMNTRFRYIVEEHPPGETMFSSLPQERPYWTYNSDGEWKLSLPEGKYAISYPDGLDADPLRLKVTISWYGSFYPESSLSLETIISMTPGRFRGSS